MLGEVKNDIGIIFKKENYKVVRKSGVAGDIIPTHNHVEEEIVFSVLSGEVEVTLNGEEVYELKAFDVLNFDGINNMEVKFVEDSEILITLVKK